MFYRLLFILIIFQDFIAYRFYHFYMVSLDYSSQLGYISPILHILIQFSVNVVEKGLKHLKYEMIEKNKDIQYKTYLLNVSNMT